MRKSDVPTLYLPHLRLMVLGALCVVDKAHIEWWMFQGIWTSTGVNCRLPLCALCIFPLNVALVSCISKWYSPPLLWWRQMHIGPSLSGRRTQEQALGRRLRFRGTFWSGRDILSFYVLSKGAHEWVEWSYIGFQICSSCWTYKHQFKGYKIKRCQGLQVQRFPKIQAKIRSTGAGDPFSDMELHQS